MVEVFTQSSECLNAQGVPCKTANSIQESVAFIIDRLKFFAKQTSNLRDEVMEAVIRVRPADCCDIFDLLTRMRALQAMALQADFEPLMIGFKRAHRIVEKEQWQEVSVDPGRFIHEAEHTMFRSLGLAQRIVSEAVVQQDYEQALRALLELKVPIDEFFGSVLVNDDSPAIRANRLSLLAGIDRVFCQMADFSCMPSGG